MESAITASVVQADDSYRIYLKGISMEPTKGAGLQPTSPDSGAKRRRALKFVLMIGAVSFFADFTYEGSRSITGPFLQTLGATGAIVGIVAGLGELLGYGLRFFP